MTEAAEIVADHEVSHGDFSRRSRTAQAIKRVLVASPNWRDLSDGKKEACEMIAVKLSRILHGDSDVRDHWDDIGGYSKLAADSIGKD